ncbi:flagellar hook assembly protein FlgD [Aquibacillus sp. 3ASR75-11]|uniref:Flagellar hook assembly protein FlgD n=1 Tax=Terrihalobacillus insolitus TaxID=2950438 RepID=A0A9X3WUK2_9BACI|nr:flagellar hook assembly protein FlgD [Terrihalobacillus insolitus]MDC3414133.1 flagellar hook assembly protein FlgD [Terrihalobacillus insolitus]MDC3423574.1 flagellar hook assembly protein FlgD [Terrihalobacillus insolitus]
MTKIDPANYLTNQTVRGSTSSSLGKDEFLKILMAQLQNQDPLKPMDDKEFISQMTTFSSLEQTMNMSSSIEQLVKSQTVSPVLQYSNLIGKKVTYPVLNDETGKVVDSKQGLVVAVSQKDGVALLELDGGDKIDVESITRVSEPKV